MFLYAFPNHLIFGLKLVGDIGTLVGLRNSLIGGNRLSSVIRQLLLRL